jgi:cystathionine beta-lyase/cystathionine gamma-synthase
MASTTPTSGKQASGKQARFATRAIHVGQQPDPATGAVVAPIHQASTFAQKTLGKYDGYLYSRVGNPTRAALEACLASLEGGVAAFAFGSGMAAINAVASLLNAGDHVLCQDNLYGGTVRLFNQVVSRFGVEFTYVDASPDPAIEARLNAGLRPNTRLLYLETPTNPLLQVVDLRACCRWARRHKLAVAVDNTFLTPYFQRPIESGADFVIHSTTKYLNGHSDGIGGAVICRSPEDADRIKFLQKAAGAVLAPFECWLVLRGVKSLAVRMRQHEANAMAIAKWLRTQKKVRAVHYPGLSDHPQHKLARRQTSGFGGMLSFDLETQASASRFVEHVRLFAFAESLGGVESLLAHPATMSHAGITAQERAAMGIGEGLLRVSAGIEDAADLIADLEQALRAV